MKLDYRPDGRIIPVLEVGDLVRLTRDEPGPEPTALSGEWGRILRITVRKTLDIQLAGFSRPRSVAMTLVRDIPSVIVVPCDARGLPKRLPSWSEINADLPSRHGQGV
jgi:hypothetical protein